MYRILCVLAVLALIPTTSAQMTSSLTLRNPVSVEDLGHGSHSTARLSGTNLSGGIDITVPDGGWVYGIEIGERSDQPCHLVLKWATIDDGAVSLAETPFSDCHGEPTSRSVTALGYSYASSYDEWTNGYEAILGGPLGLTILATSAASAFDSSVPRNPFPVTRDGDLIGLKGLRVCQRNSNDEMKGLAVRAVTLTPQATSMRTRPHRRANGSWDDESFQRPNCNDWDDMEMCPNQQVMVGVHIERERSSGARKKSKIKGLAPICARIEVES